MRFLAARVKFDGRASFDFPAKIRGPIDQVIGGEPLMSLRLSSRLAILFLVAWLVTFVNSSGAKPQAADPMDWPNWRGPQQNRASTEKDLVEKWNPEGGEGSNLL